jgi:zinc transport system ATP-binding protein
LTASSPQSGAPHHHHDGCCGHEPSVGGHVPAPFDASALIGGRGLHLARSGRELLMGVDIDVHPGEIVTLIGPNGAGKTTLVRVLLGLETPDRGGVRRRAGLVVGYVPQRFDIERALPLSVDRFLALGTSAPAKARAAALAEVGAAGTRDNQLFRLSGGELQRVMLGRALLRGPGLLVLDEPARGVDYTGEAELYTMIGRLRRERGLGILLVSHDLHVVMAQSDRVVCINRHVCCEGRPVAVASHPEYVRLFGAKAAASFALYEHHHDHRHGLAGEPLPEPDAGAPPPRSARGDA